MPKTQQQMQRPPNAMMSDDADIDAFVRWFQSNGGLVDTKVMGITEFPGSGRGAIALCDISVCCYRFWSVLLLIVTLYHHFGLTIVQM